MTSYPEVRERAVAFGKIICDTPTRVPVQQATPRIPRASPGTPPSGSGPAFGSSRMASTQSPSHWHCDPVAPLVLVWRRFWSSSARAKFLDSDPNPFHWHVPPFFCSTTACEIWIADRLPSTLHSRDHSVPSPLQCRGQAPPTPLHFHDVFHCFHCLGVLIRQPIPRCPCFLDHRLSSV